MGYLKTNDSLSDLISIGGDAMSGLYYAKFTGGVFDNDDTALHIKVRMDGFTPPTATHKTHRVAYKTISAEEPSAAYDLTRQFNLNVRIDSQYAIYKALRKQRNYMSTVKGAVSLIPGANSFTVVVYGLKSALEDTYTTDRTQDESYYTPFYTFNKCWIDKLSEPNYSYENSEALTCQVSIRYLDYIDHTIKE